MVYFIFCSILQFYYQYYYIITVKWSYFVTDSVVHLFGVLKIEPFCFKAKLFLSH